METTKKSILVPWDFSEVASYALQHAVNISGITGNDIVLGHIVKKGKSADKSAKKLEEDAEEINKKYKIKPKTIVKEGTIFTAIGEMADENNSDLVVMGTHGMKGMQKLTGSWALKVIVGSKIPFIIVQAPPGKTTLKDVVFPMDFKMENIEKLNWVSYLSGNYKSKFHFVTPNTTDQTFLKGVKKNMNLAQKLMDAKGIEYDMQTAEGKGSFANETIKYAKNIEADMILVMTTKNINVADYIVGANEQTIIANDAQIPVMCVNPRPAKLGAFRIMGG